MDAQRNVYLLVFKSSIDLVLEHYSSLFDEISINTLLRVVSLSDNALILLSRSLSRKFSWLRIDSIAAYLTSASDLENALNELIYSNVFELLRDESSIPFDDIWSACSCLTVDELKVFTGIIKKSPVRLSDG